VSTWLLTIGRRKALDRLRARKRSREDLIDNDRTFDDLPSRSPDPSVDAEGSELRENVKTALRALPNEQREVLELGYFSGMSQTEIAEATGQPLGTVKTRMRLALQKLREPLSIHRGVTE
jgi:RNA polymerase sigma-70 factor (ECF subfamily)